MGKHYKIKHFIHWACYQHTTEHQPPSIGGSIHILTLYASLASSSIIFISPFPRIKPLSNTEVAQVPQALHGPSYLYAFVHILSALNTSTITNTTIPNSLHLPSSLGPLYPPSTPLLPRKFLLVLPPRTFFCPTRLG